MSNTQQHTVKIWLAKLIGFVLGFTITLLVEVALFALISWIFDSHLMPRGIGWITIPVLGGLSCAAVASEFARNPAKNWAALKLRFQHATQHLPKIMQSTSNSARAMVALPLLWVVFVALYVALFEPYGYMSRSDYHHMYKVMSFPSVALIITYITYKKFIIKQTR